MTAPTHLGRFNVDGFKAWLVERGAEVLEATNEYEVLRVRTDTGTHVVYRTARNALTWPDPLRAVYNAYKGNKAWQAFKTSSRRGGSRHIDPIVRTLLERDGDLCFYCIEAMTEDETSVEHLVPLAHGGPNHISNFVLAHRRCNQEAGHLSAMEKIKRREQAGGFITL